MWPLLTLGVLLALAAFFFWFERQPVSAEKLVLLALLSAVSATGRVLFTAIPSVQPSSFIIIMTGLTLGAGTGCMTGLMTALLSGLWMGLGPWTPWQMLAWGLMGGLAGTVKKPLSRHKALRAAYGVVWGFLFGWMMNIWMLMSVDSAEAGWVYVLGVYAASLPFDALHAAANGTLLWWGGDGFLRVMGRVAVKYGLTPPPGPARRSARFPRSPRGPSPR